MVDTNKNNAAAREAALIDVESGHWQKLPPAPTTGMFSKAIEWLRG